MMHYNVVGHRRLLCNARCVRRPLFKNIQKSGSGSKPFPYVTHLLQVSVWMETPVDFRVTKDRFTLCLEKL
jgi:hypothetical protein